jgi:diguanylate cyclase (GGDEF)-like protein/PAS domain S-box-containing protein
VARVTFSAPDVERSASGAEFVSVVRSRTSGDDNNKVSAARSRTLSVALVIFSTGPIALAALPALSNAGLIADTPLPVLIALLLACMLSNLTVQLLQPYVPIATGVQLRAAVVALSTGWFVYATGLGSLLVIAYAIGIADAVRVYGSRAWRPGLAWAGVAVVAGEICITIGLAPTVVPVSIAHLAAIATFGCLAILARTLGIAALTAETANEQVEKSRAYFHDMVQHSADVIALIGPDLELSYVSPGITSLIGRPPEECIGRPVADILGPDAGEDIASAQGSPRSDGVITCEWFLATGGSEPRWAQARITVRDDGWLILNVRDITDQRALEAELEQRAHNDALTGLPNRAALTTCLGDLSPNERITLLFIDLDGFKMINDSLGHKRGDIVLREVGQAIAAQVTPDITVGRLGGDEFLAILPHANPADAKALAAQIICSIEQAGARHSRFPLSASIGIAAGSPGDAPERLLHRADQAMYEAKETGRGQYVVRVSN